ncbi:hypothetical protein D043_0453A, partial [Vibrio parahaemolyticus EKP-021]
MSDEHPAK